MLSRAFAPKNQHARWQICPNSPERAVLLLPHNRAENLLQIPPQRRAGVCTPKGFGCGAALAQSLPATPQAAPPAPAQAMNASRVPCSPRDAAPFYCKQQKQREQNQRVFPRATQGICHSGRTQQQRHRRARLYPTRSRESSGTRW